MAGFDNDVVYAKNADFTQADNNNIQESNGLFTNGNLWIGSTSTNAGGTHINVGNLTSPDSSITFGYSSPNITAIVNQSVVPDLHVARYIVASSTSGTGANFTSIAAAIAAAQGTGVNSTIFIQPGTYTENFTLPPGINLTAFDCDSNTPNVTIVGTITMTAAGISTISGIRLQTNSAPFLTVSGSANSIIYLKGCYLNATNNTGISYTSSGTGSMIVAFNCFGDVAANGIAPFSSSGAGNITFINSFIGNSGSSTTACTISAGIVGLQNSGFASPITTSGTAGINCYFSTWDTSGTNTTALTHGGTGTANNITLSEILSGSASAISISQTLNVHYLEIISSNVNAITGAGTLISSHIAMGGTSAAMNITNNTLKTSFSGGISFDKGVNVLNTYATSTWVPTIVPSGTNFTSITYGTRTGTWTKIGNLVTVSAYIPVTAITVGAATGDLTFPLPFAVAATESTIVTGAMRCDNQAISGKYVIAVAGATATAASAQMINTTAAPTNLPASGGTSNMAFAFTITYRYA